jgi:uncharacterized protein YdeI (BOF family)
MKKRLIALATLVLVTALCVLVTHGFAQQDTPQKQKADQAQEADQEQKETATNTVEADDLEWAVGGGPAEGED